MGATGADVMFLQCLLNKQGANPLLTEDGAFGARTKAAVMAFQRSKPPLTPDGIVGVQTWNRFGVLTERLHNVQLRGQPTGSSCWSAAATMIVGNMSVGPGRATLEPSGGLSMPLENIETFLAGLRWRMINNQSRPAISTLINGLRRGPLWVAYEGGSFQHAVVYSGFYTDSSGDESATVFRIHDPWPPDHGTMYSSTYRSGVAFLRSVQPPRRAMIQYVAAPN
jgi:hypothetical protein